MHEQCRADSFPQEHFACAAQTQPAPGFVLQQVVTGWTILSILLVVVVVVVGLDVV